MKKDYKFGDYYSPLDIVKIAKKKLKRMKWSVLLLPIGAIIFLFNVLLSIALYPLFILNKYFNKLKIYYTPRTLFVGQTVKLLADILHELFYCFYWILMPINRFFVTVYKIFPNRVVYFSNQSTIWYADDINEVKERYRTQFYEIFNCNNEECPNKDDSRLIEDLFEADFFKLVYDSVPYINNDIED